MNSNFIIFIVLKARESEKKNKVKILWDSFSWCLIEWYEKLRLLFTSQVAE